MPFRENASLKKSSIVHVIISYIFVTGIPKFVTRSEAANLLSNSESPVFLLNQDEDDVILIDVADKGMNIIMQ